MSIRCKNDQDLARLANSTSFRGLVVNDIQTLGSEERNLLSQGMPPGTNIATCWIFQEGREPKGAAR